MLINCVVYERGHKVADVAPEEIAQHLLVDDRFVWVALKDPSDEELEQLRTQFSLHPLAVEDARVGHQRPKVEEYGSTLFSVIHLLELVDGDISVGEVDVFVDRRFVLSVRSKSDQNFLGVRQRCESEPELLRQGSGFVFYAILDVVVDRYFQLLEHLETELEAIESQIFTRNAARQNIERLYNLKRKTMIVRHAALPMLEFIGKLYGGRVPPVCQNSQEYFRDVHDHLARIVSTIDGIREAAATAIQVNLSMVAIEESEVTKKLAAWASIFAASTALAGIWGMNFEHMPELKWMWGYPFALCVIVCVSALLFYRFRRAGWL